jgi:hypothetical protein
MRQCSIADSVARFTVVLPCPAKAGVVCTCLCACGYPVASASTSSLPIGEAEAGCGKPVQSHSPRTCSCAVPQPGLRTVSRSDPDFGAFINALGLLGVITTVTMRMVPLDLYTLQKLSVPVETFTELYPALNSDETFAKAWWFPHTGLVHVWHAREASRSEWATVSAAHAQLCIGEDGVSTATATMVAIPAESTARTAPLPQPTSDAVSGAGTDAAATLSESLLIVTDPTAAPVVIDEPISDETVLHATLDHAMAVMAAQTKDADQAGPQFRTLSRFRSGATVCGTREQLFCKGIPVPQINCELGVPLEKFADAVRVLQQWSDEHGGESLHYPFIFRCVGASDAWVSATAGVPTCFIGFLVYLAKDGTAEPGSMLLMRSLQEVLAPLGAIPHLGKHFLVQSGLWQWSRLPHLRDFLSLRRTLDPQNLLVNDFLHTLLDMWEADCEGAGAGRTASGSSSDCDSSEEA